jgi:hypothetical protein
MNYLYLTWPDGTCVRLNIREVRKMNSDPDEWFGIIQMLAGGPPAPFTIKGRSGPEKVTVSNIEK